MKLRPYQQEALEYVKKYLKSDSTKPVIVQASVGYGKSLLISAVANYWNKDMDRGKVLVLQPNKELLTQNRSKMEMYHLPVSSFSASVGEKEVSEVTMGTLMSCKNVKEKFLNTTMLLIDECDFGYPVESSSAFLDFIGSLPKLKKIIGFTATPYKLVETTEIENYKASYFRGWSKTQNKWAMCKKYGMDMKSTSQLKMLTDLPYKSRKKVPDNLLTLKGTKRYFWSKIIYAMDTWRLQKEDYLSPLKYFTESKDYKDLKLNSNKSDYTEDSLEKFSYQTDARIIAGVNYCLNRKEKVIVYCNSLAQCERLKVLLKDKCEIISGNTPTKQRTQVVEDFKSGKLLCMLNLNCLTAGFDCPDLNNIIMARPTISPRLWYQIIGRVIRKDPSNPDKVGNVFDIVGLCKKLGMPENYSYKDGLVYKNKNCTQLLVNQKLASFSLHKEGISENVKTKKNQKK